MTTPTLPAAAELPKRQWHYLQPPATFDVAGCACGNQDTQWSEFEKHLWCAKCEIDFIPAHAGVFDGPIPTKLAHMMGMRFDRLNLVTQKVERFDVEKSEYVVES